MLTTTPNQIRPSTQARLQAIKDFYDLHGHCRIPRNHRFKKGSLQKYRQDLRSKHRAGTLNMAILEYLNEATNGTFFEKCEVGIASQIKYIVAYMKETGDKRIDWTALHNGNDMGRMAKKLRQHYRAGRLSTEEIEALESNGFLWDIRETADDTFETNLALLAQYIKETGDLKPPSHLIIEGRRIGNWLVTCRTKEAKGQLSTDQRQALETIGVRVRPYNR